MEEYVLEVEIDYISADRAYQPEWCSQYDQVPMSNADAFRDHILELLHQEIGDVIASDPELHDLVMANWGWDEPSTDWQREGF